MQMDGNGTRQAFVSCCCLVNSCDVTPCNDLWQTQCTCMRMRLWLWLWPWRRWRWRWSLLLLNDIWIWDVWCAAIAIYIEACVDETAAANYSYYLYLYISSQYGLIHSSYSYILVVFVDVDVFTQSSSKDALLHSSPPPSWCKCQGVLLSSWIRRHFQLGPCV